MLRRRLLPAASRMVAAAAPGGSASATAATSPLFTSTAIFGAANALGFGISVLTGSHVHLDLIGTGIFSVAALATYGGDMRQRCSALGVAAWATKLSSFLFYRALQTKHDARLEETLSTNAGAAGFWIISGAWGVIVSLPHVLAAGVPLAARPPFGRATDLLGLSIFATGLLLETAADYQKWAFKSDPGNKGAFCDVGVWQISQHPNWFGNLVLWSGLVLLNAPTLLCAGTPLRRAARMLGALVSPAFLLALFYAQATDALAKTAAMADAKYGHLPKYQQYVATTPLVVPTAASVARLWE